MRWRWLYLWLGLHGVGIVGADALPVAQDAARVICESRDGSLVRCPLATAGQVQLLRQLSATPCIRGSQWDRYDGGIWVSQGCRGEFTVLVASASEQPQRRVLRCSSSGGLQSCPVRLRGAPVRLLRQLSLLPCREGRSWGVRRNEIWTTRGCDGEFEIGDAQGRLVEAPWLIECASRNGMRQRCGASIRLGARLHRQFSRAACEEGRSWGWNSEGIWVDDGCRGEFLVQ